MKDIRFALRVLLRNPAYTIVALLTMVLVIGGVSTVFTLVHTVLLRPLPFPSSERLVRILETNPGLQFGDAVSAGMFQTIENEGRSFDLVAGYGSGVIYTLDPDTDPYQVRIGTVTPHLFRLLGIQPILGRWLEEGDEATARLRAALISRQFWQERLGGRDVVVGQRVPVSTGFSPDRDFELVVVGVMPEDVELPFFSGNGDFPEVWTLPRFSDSPSFRRGVLTVTARLGPGVEPAQAQAELSTISSRVLAQYPDDQEGRELSVTPLIDTVVGDTDRLLWMFLGAVACVVLIGVANLTSLQIVRNTAREGELHMRAALGASRGRLVRQLLIETVTLGASGGLLGLLAGWAGVRLVLSALPSQFPRSSEIAIDPTVVSFAMVLALAAGLTIGLVSTLGAGVGENLRGAIAEAGRSTSLGRRRGRLQRVLIGVETALALVLLVGAALLTHSLWQLFGAEAGMDERNLWMVQVSLPLSYRDFLVQETFWKGALTELRQLEEVGAASAAINAGPPLGGFDIRMGGLLPEGSTADPMRDGLAASHRPVMPGYFETLGVPILRGRPILESDVRGGDRVVVLNETAAGILWPGQDPLGRRIQGTQPPPPQVVGIVPDFKLTRLDAAPSPQMYSAYVQEDGPGSGGVFMVRAKDGAGSFPQAAEAVIHNLEEDAEVEVSTMSQIRWRLVAAERFRTAIVLLFGLTAVFLALLGIFGVVAYSVVQRNREIGIRMALGAQSRNVVWLMLREGMWPTVLGLAVGLLAAFSLTRVLSSYLYEIEPTDPLTLTVAVAGLFVAAVLAGLAPARRATHVHPMNVLRNE